MGIHLIYLYLSDFISFILFDHLLLALVKVDASL